MARSDSTQDSSSDSSKKVAKAAKAGATPSSNVGREQRSLGFPMALVGIVVLGTALVAFAWNARDVEALQPSFGDHWHLPFAVYDCRDEAFIAPLEDPGLVNSGIHTHSDGVIHLHPSSSTATGSNARLGVFLDATRANLSDDALTFDTRPEIAEEGASCNGEDAILQVARFEPGDDVPVEVLTENLTDLRFRGDQEAVIVALLPEGADWPTPPADAVANAQASSPNILATDGLSDLSTELQNNNLGGFNEDGVLVDGEGTPILDGEGNEITQQSIQAEAAELEAEAEEAEE